MTHYVIENSFVEPFLKLVCDANVYPAFFVIFENI